MGSMTNPNVKGGGPKWSQFLGKFRDASKVCPGQVSNWYLRVPGRPRCFVWSQPFKRGMGPPYGVELRPVLDEAPGLKDHGLPNADADERSFRCGGEIRNMLRESKLGRRPISARTPTIL